MMYQTDQRSQPEVARLEDYLNAFRQRKLLVGVVVAFGLILALLYSRGAADSYTATSTVRLGPSPVGSPNNNLAAPRLEKESQVVGSDAVTQGVLRLHPDVDLDALDVKFTPNSEILVISYTSGSAEQSAAVANAFAQVYADLRTTEAVEYYQTRIEAGQAERSQAAATIDTLEAEREAVEEQRRAAAQAGQNTTALVDRIGDLGRDISAARTASNQASNTIRANETALETLERASPAAQLLSSAQVPTGPDGIPEALLVLAGGLLGLTLGLIAAFLLERLDTTARDENDVALALGTSVMGAIPTLGFGFRKAGQSLIMITEGGGPRIAAAREAFRRLRGSLQFLQSSSGVGSVLVTSSSPGEGKSVTSANLALALAQNGSRVVLVSADLRRPTLERMFGMEAQRPGLSEYLAQTAELNAEKVPRIDNLWLIRAGRTPANPGELLNSDRFELMIKELEREDVEYIIVDTPPVLSTADALSAARYVDGVLVVVDAEQTDTSHLLQIRADLDRTGAKLLGAIMNRRKVDSGGLFRRKQYAYYRSEAVAGA